jgi:hypothetical protein
VRTLGSRWPGRISVRRPMWERRPQALRSLERWPQVSMLPACWPRAAMWRVWPKLVAHSPATRTSYRSSTCCAVTRRFGCRSAPSLVPLAVGGGGGRQPCVECLAYGDRMERVRVEMRFATGSHLLLGGLAQFPPPGREIRLLALFHDMPPVPAAPAPAECRSRHVLSYLLPNPQSGCELHHTQYCCL